MAVDGVLRFDTKLDTDGFSSGTKEISSKMIDLKNKIEKTESEISSLQQELEKLANTPIKSSTVTGLEKDIAKAKAELNSLYGQADLIGDTKQADLTSMGFDTKYLDNMLEQDANWQKIQQQITDTEAKLQSYEQELKSVRESESETTGKDTAEYQRKQQKLQTLSGQLDVYKARLKETEEKEKTNTSAVKKSISSLKRLKDIVSKAEKAMAGAFKNATVNTIKKLGNHAKKSSSQMGGLAKSFNMVKQALKGMIVYQGLSKIFDSVKEGMQNLAQVSPQTNKSLSMLMSALTRLKNSFATAFAPILTVVAPILTKFINMLSEVADKIAQFGAVLTGNNTYTKAVEVQQDYAKSIENTTKATKDNTKATEKNLAGYDQLNVMQQDSDSSSSTKNELLPKDMFSTATVSKSVGKFANQLKDLFDKQNFKGIGKLVGSKINNALKRIKWLEINKTLKSWAGNIANLLNGFIKGADWDLIGTTVAKGINAALIFAERLVGKSGVNFKKIGQSLAKALSSLLKKLNTKLLGKTLANVINAIINFADGFSYVFDWKNFGKQIKASLSSFINNLNLKGAQDAFVNSINGFVTAAINFIGTPNFFSWGQKLVEGIKSTLQKINWQDITKLFSTLVLGALRFVSGIVVSINWEELGEAILTSFTNFFGKGGVGYEIIKILGNVFFNMFFGALAALDTIVNGVDWKKFGDNLAKSFSVNTGDKSWTAILSKTANDIVIALLDFINGVFEKQESADKFASGFETMLNNIKWDEIFIKALSAIFNIASWLIQLAGDLISDFCKGLAIGFLNAENNDTVNSALQDLGKSIVNCLITLLEQGLRIIVNAIPNFFLGLLKLLYNAFAGLLGLILGDDFYQRAVDGLWGSNSWQVDIPVNIPRLATGTVVPANYGEFLAVLGDNKREAEVVSPISTIKQALIEAMAEVGSLGDGGEINLTVNLDGEVIFNNIVKRNNAVKKRHGVGALG